MEGWLFQPAQQNAAIDAIDRSVQFVPGTFISPPPPAPPAQDTLTGAYTSRYPDYVHAHPALLPAIQAGFAGLVMSPPATGPGMMMQNTVVRVRVVGPGSTTPR